MKHLVPLLLLAAVWVPNPALANRAPPPPPPEKKGPNFVIQVDDNAKQAKLIIPKTMMPEEKVPKKTGWLSVPTVVVAICLSAALFTGGLWVVRRGKGGVSKSTLALILAVTLVAASSATAWADLLPPKDRAKPKPVPVQEIANLPIEVEVVEKGDAIILVVNKEQFKQLTAPPAKPVPAKPAKPVEPEKPGQSEE